MNTLGEVIRVLMGRRNLTGVSLAAEIGLSATSLSRIVMGHSRPKQVTLTRLMKRLCATAQEEQVLLRAFTGAAEPIVEEPVDASLNAVAERERVERWLEARTQAITFKNAVARELDAAGISYRRDVCEGIASADFIVQPGAGRIALECKFNVSRDFDKALGVARLQRELMRCDSAVIVVPFHGDSDAPGSQIQAQDLRILTPGEAVHFLQSYKK